MKAHGYTNIYHQGQVLWIRVQGGINLEFSEQYRDSVISAATEVSKEPWIRVTDIREWQLGGPEIIPALNQLMRWCEEHNMAHSINLVSMENLQVHMLDQMMQGVSRHSERHVLKTLDDTLDLLQHLSHPVDSTPLLTALYPELNTGN
ncbi:hypothetical protein ACFSJ3_13585 [Corallincola platygyrae]|uniref:STAS domain-containing protein n=1 Tax=Corallincola platygyrae TaxID=1193278 RepID=A0ABW4XPH1_9GAMM